VPVGEYSILFRIIRNRAWGGFAIDNIGLTTCPCAPPTVNYTTASFLTYSCDFEQDQCQMTIQKDSRVSFYNFTRINANMLEDKTLGPLVDHTTNTSNGYFLYWNYTLPFLPKAIGQIITSKIDTDIKMCLQFSYYLKSPDNITNAELSIDTVHSSQSIWDAKITNTNGWQTVTVQLPGAANTDTIKFSIEHDHPGAMAFALDDIIFDR